MTNLTFQFNIIFLLIFLHRFDEKLKLALAINVCGTREILTLSREIENLKVSNIILCMVIENNPSIILLKIFK